MYQYVEFDGVSLPLFDHSQNHDPMAIESTLRDSVGGTYDWRGSQRRAGRRQVITFQGVFQGGTEYLVDDVGDTIVDESGDGLIAGSGQEVATSAVMALLEKMGERGPLWRKRLTDDTLQWKTARLLAMPWPRSFEEHGIRAEPRFQFETKMQYWHAATASTATGSATATVPLLLAVHNGGAPIDDASIRIKATSGTITAVAITCSTLGIDLDWTGTLPDGDELVIDCGDDAPAAGVTDAYSGFSRGANHTANGWMPIASGVSVFRVTVTGGNAMVTITYYEQVA